MIEPLLAPTVLLVVGLRGDEARHPVEISSSPTSTMPASVVRARNTRRSPAVSTRRTPRSVGGHLWCDHGTDGGGGHEPQAVTP